MSVSKPSECPKCRADKIENTGRREFYRLGADREKESPSSIIYSFKCDCGHSWGVEVKSQGAAQSAAAR
jgi:hypothetical protein